MARMGLGWLLIVVLLACVTRAFAQSDPVSSPVGLFVCRGPSPTPQREVDFPFIDGWLVRPGWDKVEPREGQYDFSYIENEIALARRLKKKVALAVLGGPQTPAWVYTAGARSFSYTIPVGRRGAAQIPLLWDDTYLRKWTALVRELGKRFGSNDTVVLVHMTGATGNGLEMQLPFTPQDRQAWEVAGYTPEKTIAAWKQIIDAYAQAFANRPLDIDVHPVLGSDRVAEAVAAYGSAKLGRRFGIFSGWLSGKPTPTDPHHAGMHAIAARYGPKGFAAFQMIASYTRTPTQFPPEGLKAAIEQGLSWNAHYFEIWETDAMNPELHPLLQEMAAKLRH